MRKLFYVACVALLALFGLTFSLHNRQTIVLKYYAVEFQTELVVLLLLTFGGGLLLGFLLTWIGGWRSRRRFARRMRELHAKQQLARAS